MMSEGKYAPVAATTSYRHWRTVAVALGLFGVALFAWSGHGPFRGVTSLVGTPAAAATRMSVGLEEEEEEEQSTDCGCTGKSHECVGKCPGWTDPKGKADCVWQCGADFKTCAKDCADSYSDQAKDYADQVKNVSNQGQAYVKCAKDAKSCLLACKDDPSNAHDCVGKCHDDFKLCD